MTQPLGFQTPGEDVFGPYLKHRTSGGIWKTRELDIHVFFPDDLYTPPKTNMEPNS